MKLRDAIKQSEKAHKMWLAGAVEAICVRDGCTRDELAEALGVVRSTLWTWTEGVSMPRLRAWIELRALIDGRAVVRRGQLRGAGE